VKSKKEVKERAVLRGESERSFVFSLAFAIAILSAHKTHRDGGKRARTRRARAR
jgi:hypothetical protein